MAPNKYLTFVAVLLIASIIKVHSTLIGDDFDNRDTNIILGRRYIDDLLLRKESIARPAESGVLTHPILVVIDDAAHQNISYVSVKNKGTGRDRGHAKVAAGGVGEKSIELELNSELRGGLYFDVEVYAISG